MNDGDKQRQQQQQETTAVITATGVISSLAAQAHDGVEVERDGGQAGGLGTAVCSSVWTKCETSCEVRFVEGMKWK
jgi:hypothetical protein